MVVVRRPKTIFIFSLLCKYNNQISLRIEPHFCLRKDAKIVARGGLQQHLRASSI